MYDPRFTYVCLFLLSIFCSPPFCSSNDHTSASAMDHIRMNMKPEESETESGEKEIESNSKTMLMTVSCQSLVVADIDTFQVPFERQFPLEILDMIVSYADCRSLAACLRVSKQFFDMAGERLYGRIEIDSETDWVSIMQGVGSDDTRLGGNIEEGTRSENTARPMEINYKQILLEYVHTIVISHHCCAGLSLTRVKKTARMMTGLKRAILTSWAYCSNGDPGECLFAEELQFESLTIHERNLDTLCPGDSDSFDPVLDTVQHATLVISPTMVSLKDYGLRLNGRDEGPPLKLESLRLIFAHNRLDAYRDRDRQPSVSMESLIESVAPCLKLGKWKIEIFIFNDFDSNLDLVDFRDKLKIAVDDAIKALPKKERPKWTPEYQVFGLEDYFNRPDMYLELDHVWTVGWKTELDNRQAQRAGEERIARIVKVGDLGVGWRADS